MCVGGGGGGVGYDGRWVGFWVTECISGFRALFFSVSTIYSTKKEVVLALSKPSQLFISHCGTFDDHGLTG